MREQRGHLSAEELRELNEFTVEDADHEADVRNHLNQPTKKPACFLSNALAISTDEG